MKYIDCGSKNKIIVKIELTLEKKFKTNATLQKYELLAGLPGFARDSCIFLTQIMKFPRFGFDLHESMLVIPLVQ